ncbi:alpha/beta fold hydrolase [Nocardia nova]|uniref:alpha/beta fold hydrolase n=1 Tax=Nocardia nova TaxID=37330 RepID=UPI002157CF54|nr:alpha/beta hydrolase [Nocardia nova]
MRHLEHSLPGAGVRLAADRWVGDHADGRGVVVLLHGGGQTRHSWRRTGIRLAEAGWVSYAIDLRGHGDSDWHSGGDYSVAALVEDLRKVLVHIRQENPGLPVALVGASMGGKISLIAAGEDTSVAQALVLVDIAVRVEVSGGRRVREFMQSAPDGFASLEEASARIAAYNPHRPRPSSVDGLRKNLRLRGDRWYWHWDPALMRSTDGDDDRPVSPQIYERAKRAAQRITCPVLLVRGQLSDVVSDEGVAEMRELIPHSQVIDVREVGHMVAGDDNDVFTASLIDYLDSSLSARGSSPDISKGTTT